MPHARTLSRIVLAAAVLALPACQDSTGAKAGPAAHLDILSGNAQTAPVLTELPQPVVVKVTDAQGHKVKNQVVNFVVTAGGGHVFAGTAITNDDGVAQERWTLGGVAGAPQALEARAVDSSTGQALVFATFTATATPGAPVQASALGGDTIVVGVPGSVVEDSFAVLVRDQYGNPTPGAQVAWAATSGGGSITSPTTTDASGIARTQWVLGPAGPATQSAQAAVGASTVRFVAYPVTSLTKVAGDGVTQGAGSVVTVTVGTNGPGGLPIHFAVASGGGSVAPAVVRTTDGAASSNASAQWTLGAAGPQTLTASAGNLSVTFTATAVAAGKRTLLANLPGRILDLDATRVLWLDSATTRQVKLRTLATGADVVVVGDQGADGRLTPAGALAVRGSAPTGELFEYRDGTVSSLGPIGFTQGADEHLPAVDGSWAAWMTSPVGTVIRRDLTAGTNVTVTGPLAYASKASVDVGSNGDVVYEYFIGSQSGGNSYIKLYHDGITTDVGTPFTLLLTRPQTDGGNVVFTTLSLFKGLELWLWRAGTTERLTGKSAISPPVPDSRLASEWVAYTAFTFSPATGTSIQVRLRTPGGADEPVSPAGPGYAALLEALCSDGSVVYSEDTHTNGGPVYTRRYIAYRGGPLVDAGAYDAATVVCRGGRFFLFSGGTGYELSQ
jgi:hypothetical protein